MSEEPRNRRATDEVVGMAKAVDNAALAVAGRFFDFIDERKVIRRIAFFFVLFYLTPHAFFWTFEFASTSPRPGMEVAAIIAAIWLPMSGLQTAVIAFYGANRTKEGVENGK